MRRFVSAVIVTLALAAPAHAQHTATFAGTDYGGGKRELPGMK